MSNDLRTISEESRELLLNEEIIAINQDPLGKQGGYIWINDKQTQTVWVRELADPNTLAVVLQNTGDVANITFDCTDVPTFVKEWHGQAPNGPAVVFHVRNLLTRTDYPGTQGDGTYQNAFHDEIKQNSVGMYKLTRSM